MKQFNDAAVVIHLRFNNEDGLQFEAGYHSELIDRGKAGTLSIFEQIIIQRILGFANDLETISTIFGYQKK